MNLLVSAIVVTGVLLLIHAVLMRGGHGTDSGAPQGEAHERWEDENRRRADGDARLTQRPQPDPRPNENVTSSLTDAADRGRCPACGADITANDESCPSCEISFVADGSQKWTPKAVGPADGIYLPPTEVSE